MHFKIYLLPLCLEREEGLDNLNLRYYYLKSIIFCQFLENVCFFLVIDPFWRGVASLLSILAAAKQWVYSKEYTVRGIPRALARGPSYQSFGIASHEPGNGSAGRRICQ